MTRLPTIATAAVLVAFGLACAGDTGTAVLEPMPPVAKPPPSPNAPVPMTPTTTSLHRHPFHSGRFSIEVPFERPEPGDLAVKGDSRKSTFRGAWHGGVVSVSVTESLKDSPENKVDAGMVSFVMKGQVRAGDVELARKTVPMPAIGKQAELVHLERDGKRQHVAVFPLDDLTIAFLVVLDRQPVETSMVESLLASIQMEQAGSPTAGGGTDVDPGAVMKSLVKRGKMSKLEANNQPRSQKLGKPSVISSCYLMTRECYDTSVSAVGKGFYSDEKACPGDYSRKPCPEEGRIGFCDLDKRQLISFYGAPGASTAAQQSTCETTYKGTWLGLPDQRPWPVNTK